MGLGVLGNSVGWVRRENCCLKRGGMRLRCNLVLEVVVSWKD